jgi:hypothetical protein
MWSLKRINRTNINKMIVIIVPACIAQKSETKNESLSFTISM